MANVFETLAQQEMTKYNNAPQRRLQDLQLKKLEDEQAYQDKFKTAMANPQGAMSLSSLGNPIAGPAVPNSPMGPQAAKQPSIVDQFKQQYDFHTQNGRTDLAQQVMEHQIDLSSKAAKVAEQAYKTGGKEGLAAWLTANPTFAPLLGDPAHMKLEKEGVLFPASDDKGQPVPNMYWYRGADGAVQWKEVKPEKAEVGKPFARDYEEGDTKVTELYDAQGKLTGIKKAPRYKPETGGGRDEKDYRKQSYQLQKEIRGDKYVNQADDSNQKLSAMENAYAEGKKTGNYVGADQAIGYYVNKLFDPDSVVMVSEFQRVAQSQGVPSKILGSLQSVATGGIKLTDESRDALIRTVKEINNTVQTRKADRLKQYRMDAISLGLDPDKVLAGRDAAGGAPKDEGKGKAGPKRSTAPVVSYFKGNASKFAQDKMVQQLRKSGWSDAEIGAAWAEYKRGR